GGLRGVRRGASVLLKAGDLQFPVRQVRARNSPGKSAAHVNAIKDTMWKFLMDKGQKSNIDALKEYVYDLIKMTTQKDAGQRRVKSNISWDELDMVIMSIVIEATALVLSGDLDGVKKEESDER
ncbi:hypothetical protein, partial [Gemmiger sp. An50]|uniref:hypothetical protein n=1 Tax=Gemmiger sp. An50 TaxID=1965639 RepID=UPI001FA825E7